MSAERPGALLGTRLSVLAAECADPDRFGRGRAAFREGAVSGLEIEPGAVSARVQGSQAVPYEVSLLWRPGGVRPAAVPTRAQLVGTCSCPDVAAVCKHMVSVLFAMADQVALDPALLDTWRGDPSQWEHLPVSLDELPEFGRSRAERQELADFFGVRDPSVEFEVAEPFPEIRPLGAPARPTPSAVEAAVAECLDAAMSTLRSVFG